jgi:dTDP-4-amino-4,6-dideoxygalactose transaminase
LKVPFNQIKQQYHQDRQAIDEAIKRVLESGQYIGGEAVRSFEENLASFHQSQHVIGCANGTDALFIALKALGIGPGDEVITTAYSWISTALSISRTGATPVFVDVTKDRMQLDLTQAKSKINSRTKALLPVHLYGDITCRQDYFEFAKKNDLSLVEDAAQVHGLSMRMNVEWDRHVACYSFYPTKQLGALGDAGAVVTENSHLAQKMKILANLGSVPGQNRFEEMGINSRLDPIQASVLTARLTSIKERLEIRRAHATRYSQRLSGLNAIKVPPLNEYHSLYQYVILTHERDHLRNTLDKHSIGTGVHYDFTLPGSQPYGSRHGFKVAENAARSVLSLPIDPTLSQDQIDYVCQVLIEVTS